MSASSPHEKVYSVSQAELAVRQAWWRSEPFLAVMRHDPIWTRQRWHAARAELVLRDGRIDGGGL